MPKRRLFIEHDKKMSQDQGWYVTNAAEAVDLAGLDDQDVTCAGFELLSIDGPDATAFSHKLQFIVGMTMGPGTTAGESTQEEDGDVHVTVVGPDELVRAALKRQLLLTDAVHSADAPVRGC